MSIRRLQLFWLLFPVTCHPGIIGAQNARTGMPQEAGQRARGHGVRQRQACW